MKLKFFAEVTVGKEGADFYMIRRGSHSRVGLPVRDYGPELISIRVKTTKIEPEYLFWMMTTLWSQGIFKALAKGTTALVHITTDDVKNIRVTFR